MIARTNHGDHQKSAESVKRDKVPENEFNCLGPPNKFNQKRFDLIPLIGMVDDKKDGWTTSVNTENMIGCERHMITKHGGSGKRHMSETGQQMAEDDDDDK